MGVWEIFTTLVILRVTIIILLAPIIAILSLFIKGLPFLGGWIVSSIVLIFILVVVGGTALVVNYFEDKVELKKAEEEHEKTKETSSNEISTDHIVMGIYTAGGFGSSVGPRYKRGNNLNISYVVKNHNEADFEGTATIYLIDEGETIDELEVPIQVEAGEEESDYVDVTDLDTITRENWYGLEFDYTLDGEFVE